MYVLSVVSYPCQITITNGGVLTVGGLLDIGYGMRGVIMQHGGSLIVNALNIGFNAAGFGVYTQLAGTVRATTIQLGCGATKDARGEYYLSGDASLYVGTMRVGFEAYSTNTFCQVGGTVVVSNSLQIGGALLVTNGSNIIIGYDATGTFLLGNSNTAGRIDTVVPGTNWGSLAVGRNAGSSSQGLFRGWGALHLNQIWLTLKGKIVADGYGQERTLDLSNLNSTSPYYTADPDNNGTAGWYAQNKGRLLLKPIAITAATYQWGHIGFEQTSKTNFVNSARLTFAGTTSGAVSGALLATDRSDVPAGIIHPSRNQDREQDRICAGVYGFSP